MKPETLAQGIRNLIVSWTESDREFCEKIGVRFIDSFADTRVLTGDNIAHSADVVLTYDGAGYDFLSYYGEGPMMGLDKYRDALISLATQNGYMVEDHNSWSMGFYKD